MFYRISGYLERVLCITADGNKGYFYEGKYYYSSL